MEEAKVSGIFGAKDFFLSNMGFPETILGICKNVTDIYVSSLDVKLSNFVNAAVALLDHQKKSKRPKGGSTDERTMIVLQKYYSKL